MDFSSCPAGNAMIERPSRASLAVVLATSSLARCAAAPLWNGPVITAGGMPPAMKALDP